MQKFPRKSAILSPTELNPDLSSNKAAPLKRLIRGGACLLRVHVLPCIGCIHSNNHYSSMTSQFTTLLTSSHLDIKVPLTPLDVSVDITTILDAQSRKTLFFGTPETRSRVTVDESVNLFIIFKVPVGSVENDQLDAFLKETVLTLEVAITETTRQNDSIRREKFDGIVVHTTTITEDSERIKEQIEDHWLIAWNLSVPISTILDSREIDDRTWSIQDS